MMIRTVISLDPEDKAWLDRVAKRQRKSMTQLVRHAVHRLRQESESDPTQFERLLRDTRGLWKSGNGLTYQKKLRREWNRRR